MISFEQRLDEGRVGESLIAAWLKAKRGAAILPAYEIEKSSGKGPVLSSAEGNFVAPDMLTFTHKGLCWIEAKHKSVFTWHRNSNCWTTGIDLRHYGEYFNVLWRTKVPVWLMFYHRETTPAVCDAPYCPPECPVGLFGAPLLELVVTESHRTKPFDISRAGLKGHGKSGMVYWAEKALRQLATRDDVMQARIQMMPKARTEELYR